MEIREWLNQGTGMDIGDGRHTEFWNQKWLDDMILSQQTIRQIPEEQRPNRVCDYWQQGTGWNWEQLSQYIPATLLKRIASFELMEEEVGDKPIWVGNKAGKFDIKSAIHIVAPSTAIGVGEWRWIWKLRAPHRIQTFLWLLQHCKLLTNEARFKRKLTSNPYCDLCGEGMEDLQHLFRYCPNAQEVWHSLEREGMFCSAGDMDFQTWLQRNLFGPHEDSDWSTKFAITLWYIWKWRCASCFNNIATIPLDKGKFLRYKFLDISTQAMTDGQPLSQGIHPGQNEQWIRWEFPTEGWMVLNTDGAVKAQLGSAGAGGVIRDEWGNWIVGYSEYLGYCSIFKAELRGILRGLKIAKEHHITKLWIRTDSTSVVNALKNFRSEHREHFFLLQQCIQLLKWDRWEVQISHCFRETNQVADKLATIGTEGRLGVTIFQSPPPETHELLYADYAGVSWPRLCKCK